MKKLSPKTIKILGISIIIILMSILIYGIIDLVKDTNKNKKTQIVSMQEDITEEKNQVNNDVQAEIVYLNNLLITEQNKVKNESIVNSSSNKNNNINSNKDNTSKYYIKVNCGANVVTIYTKDSDGNYTVPYKAMICSTGTATPRYLGGKYAIKSRWEWGALFGGVYGHYCVHIVDQILFHSVPYLKASPDALEYWSMTSFGTSASAGCIRLTIKDARWIYNNIPRGTIVEFYSSSNPGPLGKPSSQKISGNAECRNWDPTDPDSGNPWHSYKEENTTNKNNTTTNSNRNNTESNNNSNNSKNNTTVNNNLDNNKNNMSENDNSSQNKENVTVNNTSTNTNTDTSTNTNFNNTNVSVNGNVNILVNNTVNSTNINEVSN